MNRFQKQKNMGKNVRLLAAPVLLTVTVIGYAMEGAYPESLEYLKEHYGLNYDETRYIINYEVMGSNLMPDVMVLEKQGS